MSLSVGPILSKMNECGCCYDSSERIPVGITNRSGLTAIAYRIGTHMQFKNAMLACLTSSHFSALGDLRTRDNDDFAIALIDAWAMVADVLTFYQERIANESYLRTATERVSLQNMARLIGYELRPGVAASTYLAFTMEEAPKVQGLTIPGIPTPAIPGIPIEPGHKMPKQTVIDIGTKVQSIPDPGEQTQIFETIEKITARVEWNAMRPRLLMPHPSKSTINCITIRGLAANLKPGDRVLLVASSSPDNPAVKRVMRVGPDIKTQTSRIELEEGDTIPSYITPEYPSGQFFTQQITLTDDVVKNEIIQKTRKQDDLLALATNQKWSIETLEASINKLISQQIPELQLLEAFALRIHASLFGHNAPRWDSLPASQRYGESLVKKRENDGTITVVENIKPIYPIEENWDQEGFNLKNYVGENREIYLDSTYPGIIKDSWLVLENPSKIKHYKVLENIEISRKDFALTAKVTQLKLNSNRGFDLFKLRETAVFAQSEKLDLSDITIDIPVQGNNIILDRAYLNLKAGMKVIVSGERTDMNGIITSEVMIIHDLTLQGGYTIMTFKETLANTYIRDTVSINANVALATHGETVNEVLGSGDAGQIYQRFNLKQPPLTHISAPTETGAESTLDVYVNDILWKEVPALYGHSPEERIYVARTDDNGKTMIQFGNGIIGAPLSTGHDNVRVTYRKGIGSGGMVKAGQLRLLLTRPLGVKDVINPLDANGASDRESPDDARRNAPLRILTLDRIVSVKDYEDFTCAYAGIAKAHAIWIWDGRKRGIFITVAGPKGAIIPKYSDLYKNLRSSIQKAADPSVPLHIESYNPVLFRLSASIRIDPDHRPEKVLDAVKKALENDFSFDTRSFGQSVSLSEIIAVIQAVRGVTAVDVDELYRADSKGGDRLMHTLPAAVPQPGADSNVVAAELLTLDMNSLDLKVMT